MSYHSRQPSIASSILSSTNNHGSSTSSIHKIGPWKLGKTLGQGSTGRVLLAEHSTTGQKAAVKVVSKSVLNSLESIGDDKGRDAAGLAYGIEREIIIMKLLNHPNVLRLYDVWETSKSLYLILEYVEGGELFDLLVERGPLKESEAVKFFRQIIMGASYCHALGICHRDLKPENLLLDADLNVKLADFGMAALENNDRLLETSCGSPHYAAPEIVSGKHYHGFESDVWSCGVILFALLTGRLPFDDENIRNLLIKVQSGRFEMPEELSVEAKNLINRMLEVNPDARIKTHEILEDPLLLKYEISSQDAKTLNELPSPNTYLNQLNNVDEIDSQILSNLITLYHGRSKEQIVSNLLKNESTTEKIFYFLLLRYRHNQSANASLMRSLSIAKSINNNHSPSSKKSNNTNRRSLISASSSHRKSVSFHRSPHRKSDSIQQSFSTQQPPVPKNLIDDFKSGYQQQPHNHQQQQQQLVTTATEVTNNRFSITPPRSQSRKSLTISKSNAGATSAMKRRSRQSLLPNKRNSITTKLISVYAKLAADSDWNFIDKEAKRTSSDFATLCDEIFDYEEKEKIRQEDLKKEKERRRLEEIERKKREEEERLEQERLEMERKAKEEERLKFLAEEEALKELQVAEEEDCDDMRPNTEVEEGEIQPLNPSKQRSVSNPTKRQSKLLDTSDISKIQQRASTNPYSSRPKSRLDPGLFYDSSESETFKNIDPVTSSKIVQEADEIVSQAIRRSKFLGSKFDLNLKRQSMSKRKSQIASDFSDERRSSKIITTTIEEYEDSKKSKAVEKDLKYDGPKTIAEVKIPQVTRKSRLYSASNKRLSVLSIYSTRESFTNLAMKLHEMDEDDQNGYLNSSPKKRFSVQHNPISMIPEESTPVTASTSTNTVGLRLSYADRLSALKQPVDSKESDEAEPVSTKKLELPELPDHFDPIPQKSDLNKKEKRLSKKFEIHEDNADLKKDRDETNEEHVPKTLPKAHNNGSSDKSQKNTSVSTTKITPLSDQTNANKRTASGSSFFRKWSSSSKQSTSSTSANDGSSSSSFFSTLFGSSAIVEGRTLNTVYEPTEMFHTLRRLLSSWNDYGLKKITSDEKTLVINGEISKNNVFGLGSSKFKVEVGKYGKKGSYIKFTKTKGSKKGFKMLESEVERILNRENVLAFAH